MDNPPHAFRELGSKATPGIINPAEGTTSSMSIIVPATGQVRSVFTSRPKTTPRIFFLIPKPLPADLRLVLPQTSSLSRICGVQVQNRPTHAPTRRRNRGRNDGGTKRAHSYEGSMGHLTSPSAPPRVPWISRSQATLRTHRDRSTPSFFPHRRTAWVSSIPLKEPVSIGLPATGQGSQPSLLGQKTT